MSVAIPTERQLKLHKSADANFDGHRFKAVFEQRGGRLRVVCATCRQRHRHGTPKVQEARPPYRLIETIGDTLRANAPSPNGVTLGQLRLLMEAAASMGLSDESRIEMSPSDRRGRVRTLTIRPAHIVQLVDEVTGRTA